ncbi:rhodanese-like domain-containing protein [Desulfomarina sp.]
MKTKNYFPAFFCCVLLSFSTPLSTVAATSIEQIRQNVVNLWQPLKQNQPHVNAVEFKKIMDSGEEFVLLDVRTEKEYNAAHLPGAIHINRGLIEWMVPGRITNPDTKIYLYCRTGARSAFATRRLLEMGYTNVTNISDAFRGWVVAGYPVYNRHGEFTLKPESFEKKDPYIEEN